MNDITELLSIGNEQLELAQRLKADEQARKKREADDECMRALEAVREALGLSVDVFGQFKPEYRAGVWPNVNLEYRDTKIGFTVDLKRTTDVGGYGSGESPIMYLATRMAEIERDLMRTANETLNKLAEPIEPWWTSTYTARSRYPGWNLPEVRLARAKMLARVFNSNVLNSPSLRDFWLDKVNEVADLPEVAERLGSWTAVIELDNKRDWLLHCIERRMHPENSEVFGNDDNWDEDRGPYGDEVSREEVDVYRAWAVTNGLIDDQRVAAAIARRELQMQDALRRAEIEDKRQALERVLFMPFTYFTVNYGIVADEDDKQMVSTKSFDTLKDSPDDDGYWTTVLGQKMRPTFVALIERVDVTALEDLKKLKWKQVLRRSTEFGDIYVAPQVAEVTR